MDAAHRSPLRLGVNIDHVATIRNARGGDHPDPVRAAEIVARVGGDGITAHLREDRRHIRDADLKRIQDATDLPLNLEMAATDEMLAIALAHSPHAACIVPEKREERTTEGGLDAAGLHNTLAPIVDRLREAEQREAQQEGHRRGQRKKVIARRWVRRHHRASSISSRIWRTACSSPTKTASPTR